MSRDPFEDLHHKETGAFQHIRLISEGGHSLAKSPRPVCIDSIQATQTCTTESQHALYRSATSCGLHPAEENLMFSVPRKHAVELDQQRIPELLRHRLEQQGSRLTGEAKVEIRSAGRAWSISDHGLTYSVRKHSDVLAVYRAA